MRKIYPLLPLLLAGCVTGPGPVSTQNSSPEPTQAPQQSPASTVFLAKMPECGESTETLGGYHRCMREARVGLLIEHGLPPNEAEVIALQSIVLADKVDAGEISQEEMDLEIRKATNQAYDRLDEKSHRAAENAPQGPSTTRCSRDWFGDLVCTTY